MKLPALLTAAVIALAGCTSLSADTQISGNINPHHYQSLSNKVFMHGSRTFYETSLEGLKSRSDYIVRGIMGNDAYMRLSFVPNSDPPRLSLGSNFVSFEVTEVLYGSLSAGQTITIMEPYFVAPFYILDQEQNQDLFHLDHVDRSAGGVFFSFADYLPSIPYQEYIFFLVNAYFSGAPEHFRGVFGVAHSERSRFRVPNTVFEIEQGFSPLESSVGPYANYDVYMSLWNEVIENFVR